MTEQFRQGDVMAVRVGSLPKKAKKTERDEYGRVVLAYGERTGHAHTLRNPAVCGYSTLDDNEIEFLLVGGGGGSLRHEHVSGAKAEHDEIALAEGVYELPVQCEYSPAELIRVAD